jgi:hypothetical protein
VPNVYNRGKARIGGALDLATGALRLLLLRTTYTFDPDQDFVSALVAHELTVGGYARQNLTGLTLVEDDALNRAELRANEVAFPSLTAGQTIGGAVLFENTGSDATSSLLAFYPANPLATAGLPVTVRFSAASPGAVLQLND